MKKWNNPELLSLGVENTFTQCTCDATTIAKDPDKNVHYCHYDGKTHQNNCPSLKEGHKQSDKCPDGGNHWSYPHVSACCCGQRSVAGPS